MTMVYLGGDRPTITTIKRDPIKEDLQLNIDIYQRMLAGMAIEISSYRGTSTIKEVLDEYYQKAKSHL